MSLVCAIVYLILMVNFSVQAVLHWDMQPCSPIVIDFSHNINVVHQFSLDAGAVEVACDAYVHIAMESLNTKFEKLLLLLECNTVR